jgi:hypothetical protein
MSEPRDDGAVLPDRERGLGGTARLVALGVGFVLAVAATLAVFLTENAQYLRLAVIAVAWAFVLAAFAAGRRRDEAPSARETAVDRRERELAIENRVRRESEQAMRAELAALRSDLAGLAALHRDLGGLGDLRNEVGRLRAELSGEMLVERIVMRTQSIRVPTELSLDPGDDHTVDATDVRPEALPPSQPFGVPGAVVPPPPAPWTDTAPIAGEVV